jgi:hypothetical protein
VVYLATTTSDAQESSERLRRELTARGHQVLPDRPLPYVADELESAVKDYLSRANYSIHLIGQSYGMIPEGSDVSIVEIQNRLAAERAAQKGFRRAIWIPRETIGMPERQQSLVRSLKEDPESHVGAEIVQDTIENLKALVLEKLAPRKEHSHDRKGQIAPDAPPRVYLICDQRDAEAVEPIEDYLFDQGFEVSLPDFEADEAEAAEIHRQNLIDCDGAIIYYGAVRHSWVDIKLRNLQKAAGYGRERELAAQCVYIASPMDRRKERFRTHTANIIREEDAFNSTLLLPFAEQLKERGASEQEAHD